MKDDALLDLLVSKIYEFRTPNGPNVEIECLWAVSPIALGQHIKQGVRCVPVAKLTKRVPQERLCLILNFCPSLFFLASHADFHRFIYRIIISCNSHLYCGSSIFEYI